VFTPKPDELAAALKAQAIMAARLYRTLSQHPAYASHGDQPFANADYWTDQAVSLPFGMMLRPDAAGRVAVAVASSGLPLENVDA
jgi:dTDP-4-amino-4,6-dideoxygalactose transaminase